jgi:nucleoside 2-deoxyribosyltransferase
MKIYFAGSVCGGRDDQGIYSKIIKLLGKYGTVLTEHIGNKALTSRGENIPAKEIFARDVKWLMSADAVITEVTNPSLGVGYEVGRFESTKRPVLCLYRELPGKRISNMFLGNPNILVKAYSDMASVERILADFLKPKP